MPHNYRPLIIGVAVAIILAGPPAFAQDDYEARASPKRPWGEFKLEDTSDEKPWWSNVLLWLPNRVMDLVDIFRLDVGAGASYGAVARISRYGQVGYREMSPLSVRVGLFGRNVPVLVERSNEFGIGPGFVESHDRSVCDGELGLGADVFVVGAYGGICIEEVVDFVAGLFFIDLKGDDY